MKNVLISFHIINLFSIKRMNIYQNDISLFFQFQVEVEGYERVENAFIVEFEDKEFPKLTKLEIGMNRI